MSAMDEFRQKGRRDGEMDVLRELLQQIEAGADLLAVQQWTTERLAPLQAEVDEIARKAAEEAAKPWYVNETVDKGLFTTQKTIFEGTYEDCARFVKTQQAKKTEKRVLEIRAQSIIQRDWLNNTL